jgi:hypothetical protein
MVGCDPSNGRKATHHLLDVMRGLVPRIHVLLAGAEAGQQDVDSRDKRGHDAAGRPAASRRTPRPPLSK